MIFAGQIRSILNKNFLVILLFLIATGAEMIFAQKTDIVILTNGDRLTGEIKKLDLDILQFKTSTMSTVQIKWYNVSNIYAPDKYCQFELTDKTMIFGNLDTINLPNALRVTSAIGEFNIPTEKVVRITQVKQVFWNRFSGNIGAGMSYTKASEVTQSNANAYVSYTDEQNYAAVDMNSIQTTQPDRTTTKQDALINYNRNTFTRQFATMFTGANRNTELGIDRRTKAGLGYGVDVIHTAVSRVRLVAAGIYNEEKTIEEQLITQNGEGFLGLDARIFKYTDPEVYLTSSFNWYPSMTIAGRHRTEVDVKLRFELLNNLFLEFTFYHTYDNKPASETAANSDYGLISGLSYTFGL